MKKTFIAVAALTVFAGGAQAQSAVTLYGVLDGNFGSFKSNQVDGASIQNLSQAKVDASGLTGSRWGMRFTEDLGGGLSAIGNLESGFSLDTGASAQGGRLFGRRAIVGLSSSSMGTVTLGRNTTSYNDVAFDHSMMVTSPFDPSNNSISTSTATAATLNTLAGKAAMLNHSGNSVGVQLTWIGFNNRFDNSIKYATPNLGGFTGSVTYSFGEDKTAAQPASKSTSAHLKYANGPLLISGGYQSEGGAINQATGTKPALQNAIFNLVYDFQVVKVGLGLNRAQYKGVTATGGDLAAQKEFSLTASVPLGALTLAAGYAQSKGDDLGKSSGFGVHALYALSKRTVLYVGGVSTKNYDKVAAAAQVQAPLSNIGRTVVYAAGINHSF